MGKKILEWQARLQGVTNAFMVEFGSLTEKDLNWKPSESVWSIAQIMEHIIITNLSYFPIFDLVKKNKFTTPWIGKIPLVPSFMGKIILFYVQPDMKKKSRTMPVWEPSYSVITVEIFRRFQCHQEEFIQWILSLEGCLEKNPIIHSPASKKIVYSLDVGIEIMVTHEERHLNQAREVMMIKDH